MASSKKDGDRIAGYGPHKLGRQEEEHRAPDRRKRSQIKKSVTGATPCVGTISKHHPDALIDTNNGFKLTFNETRCYDHQMKPATL